MRLASGIETVYRRILLPVLRGMATPLFRLAVKVAAALGVLSPGRGSEAIPGERFLIVHLSNHVGDTIMLLPMIEALREAHPGARIECAVQTPMGSLLRPLRGLDHVHEFEFVHGAVPTPWLEVRRILTVLRIYHRSIRHVRPTTCIVPRWGAGFRDLTLAYLTQAPNRIGFASNDFDRSQAPSTYRDTLLTSSVRGAQRMTEPARFLFLLEKSGIVPQADRMARLSRPNSSVRQVAATVDWPSLAARLTLSPDTPLAIVAPGASAPRRMWPVERWAAVVANLHHDGHTVILLTGPGDAALAEDLYRLVPAARRTQTRLVAGVTTLPESTCLIAHSRLFIGNDSGPGHIAGALGVPCVILFIAAEGADPDGPSAPERIRPMGEHVVCCRPARTTPPCVGYCTASLTHCILNIAAEEVVRALQSLPRLAVAEALTDV